MSCVKDPVGTMRLIQGFKERIGIISVRMGKGAQKKM